MHLANTATDMDYEEWYWLVPEKQGLEETAAR